MSSMRIYSSFDELPPEAARLFDEAGAQCFFHGLPWYRTFVNYALDPGDRGVRSSIAQAANPSAVLSDAVLPVLDQLAHLD